MTLHLILHFKKLLKSATLMLEFLLIRMNLSCAKTKRQGLKWDRLKTLIKVVSLIIFQSNPFMSFSILEGLENAGSALNMI